MTQNKHSQVTILPEQFCRLAELSRQMGVALGISQEGNVLTVYTGKDVLRIDSRGRDLDPPNQESLYPN